MTELDPEFLPAPQRCKVARLLDVLDEHDRAKFDVAFASERASNAKIADAFTNRGLKVNDETVGLHRYGTCCCGS